QICFVAVRSYVLLFALAAKKNPPPDRFWRWVRVISFLSVLLHPFPSSRRHLIRVDMPVPVDVIRFAFWIAVVMKSCGNYQELTISISGDNEKGKIQNSDRRYRNFECVKPRLPTSSCASRTDAEGLQRPSTPPRASGRAGTQAPVRDRVPRLAGR